MSKLVQDGDGHWYVIPAWMEKQYREWLEMDKPLPAWVIPVDGPHVVEFSNWMIS